MTFPMLADIAIKATILLAFLFVLSVTLRRAPAALRHLMWAAGLAALLALPVLSVTLPWQIEVLPFGAPGETPDVMNSAEGEELGPAGALGDDPGSTKLEKRPRRAQENGAEDVPAVGDPGLSRAQTEVAPVAGTDANRTASPPWPAAPMELIAAVWLLGLLLVAGRLIVGMAAIRTIVSRGVQLENGVWRRMRDRAALRLGVDKRVRLVMSSRAPVPFGTGYLRPLVVLPGAASGWSEERRFAVLLHELAHLRRRDFLAHLVAQAACAVFWFHPLVWVAARRLRSESERACDDLVLRSGTRASQYANHLIEIVRSAGRSWALAAAQPMARRSEFEGRLLAILEPDIKRHGPTPIAALTLVSAIALAAVPLAAMAPEGARAAVDPAEEVASRTLEAEPPHQLPDPSASDKDMETTPVAVNATIEQGASRTDLEPNGAIADPEPEDNVAGSVVPAEGHFRPTEKPAEPASRVEPAKQDPSSRVDRVAALVGAIEDGNPEVRQIVVQALGELQDTTAVPALARALRQDADPEVRQAAAWALGEIEDVRAIPALGEALREDEVPGVRRMAAWALGEIEDARGIEALMPAVRDADLEVRQQAIRALGEIESPAAIDVLTPALEDADARVRELAVWALGEIEDVRAVPALAQVLRSEEDAGIRLAAARALGEIESRSAVEALAAALSDGDARVRGMAVWALGEIEDPSAVDPLVGVLRDPEPELRLRAVRALGEIEDRRAIEPLTGALRDENPKVRETAAWALGEIEDPSAATGLSSALSDSDVAVRRRAAWALGEIGVRSAPPALIAALRDEDAQMRQIVARSLGEIEDPAAVAGLAALLNDPDIQVRRMAVRALGEIESPESYRVLVQALDNEDPEIRKQAARALGQGKGEW